ncbi:hypothetical protein [Metaclostridioides mangenotii]|uniref:Bifunctional DNA-binding transcriptional regulator/antitoxin component of YhaV-PrlF toxin-antitoxin module n=1 Tax=Metaclostridioides mangenotii TaxID=1540 RepID=A0ABS4E9L8_9FIRM|nr:hypothetical protein [Clostridioides mangenotii]MBP1854641.1 bifunctional DNA-binding transcriptional regulator/antitoxin component of YhaV-PrlF toxin-antitoxin module [Clostridioides mangenotii]
MKYTEKLGLKKPDQTDFYNVEDSNFNMDKIDSEITILKDGIEETKEKVDNIELTGNKVTIADAENNFTSVNVEGALQELANKDKELTNKDKALDTKIDTTKSALETAIANNKTEIDGEIANLKQSVSDGKELIATATTGRGVPTNGSDSFQKMADNIDSIKTKLPILEGDVGVTEDAEGNVYGVEKIVERLYYEAPIVLNKYFSEKPTDVGKPTYIFPDKGGGVYCGWDKYLNRISSNADTIWKATFSNSVIKTLIDSLGNTYTIFGGISIQKFSPNGELVWDKELVNIKIKDISIDKSDNIYIITDNEIKKITDEGNIIWSKGTDVLLLFVYTDMYNNVYLVDSNNNILKLTENGEEISKAALNNLGSSIVQDSIIVDNEGNIYYGTIDNSKAIVKCKSTGEAIFQKALSPDGSYSYAYAYARLCYIDEFNYLYTVHYDGTMRKFSPSGAELGKHPRVATSRAITAFNGTIYLFIRYDSSLASFKCVKDNYVLEKVAILKEREVQ